MEEKVFPSPAVADVLREHFMESRLHTDGTKNIDAILELREALTGVVTTPTYVVVEPGSGAKLATFEGGGPSRGGPFLEFLRQGLARAPAPAAAAGSTD